MPRLMTLLAGAMLLVSCFTFGAAGPKWDLTQFDLPLLLGDWYFVNPNLPDSQENFIVIKLNLESDYTFSVDIQKRDYSVEHWEGDYAADGNSLVLGLNSDDPQAYYYEGDHNTLNLNGVTFIKVLPNALAGIWSSVSLSGYDSVKSGLKQIDLILQPDFVFFFRAMDGRGKEKIHSGVFYTEHDHLVLLYENGEYDTQFVLEKDKLTLEQDDGSMHAVLDRVR